MKRLIKNQKLPYKQMVKDKLLTKRQSEWIKLGNRLGVHFDIEIDIKRGIKTFKINGGLIRDIYL